MKTTWRIHTRVQQKIWSQSITVCATAGLFWAHKNCELRRSVQHQQQFGETLLAQQKWGWELMCQVKRSPPRRPVLLRAWQVEQLIMKSPHLSLLSSHTANAERCWATQKRQRQQKCFAIQPAYAHVSLLFIQNSRGSEKSCRECGLFQMLWWIPALWAAQKH